VKRLATALGAIWLLDGLLQLQPEMFGRPFLVSLQENSMAQPEVLRRLIFWFTAVIGPHLAAWNALFALVQLALGLAIIVPRTRRLGLWCSIPWALGVWVLGEGLGGVATGFSMLPTGGPGPALWYGAIAAALLAGGAATVRVARTCWAALFLGAAVLQAAPASDEGYRLSANFIEQAISEPGFIVAMDRAIAGFVLLHGGVLTVVLVVLELVIAAAAVLAPRWRRPVLAGAITFAGVCWVIGENFGGLLTGTGSDPGQFPLIVLLALLISVEPLDDVVDAGRQRFDVARLDPRKARDTELVPAEPAVGLGVEDAVAS
jgi:hypothetical protein